MTHDNTGRFARRCGRWLIGMIGLLALVEIAIRLSGLVDFPIYDVGPPTQYIVAPSQSGRFLDRNDWYFNNKSMPIKREWAAVHPNVLLIGNSIIMGGNPFHQAQKLVSQVQTRLGTSSVVWPAAIGGWAQPNEVAYLNAHPELVASTDYIAWEYMAGHLSKPTPWGGQYTFPSHAPFYATSYVFRRYVLNPLIAAHDATGLPVTGPLSVSELRSFATMASRLVRAARCAPVGFIWLYPTKAQLAVARSGADWLPERRQVTGVALANELSVIDLAKEPSWDNSLYQPDGIHPTVRGTDVLGAVLARKISADALQRRDCERSAPVANAGPIRGR